MTDDKSDKMSRRDMVVATAAGASALALDGCGENSMAAQPAAHAFTTSGAAPKTIVPTHTTLTLKPMALTAEAFEPFGRVLTEAGRTRLPVNTYGDKLDLYRENFETDQPIEWFIVVGRPRWNGVLFLERHKQLTQTFIPVGGKPFYTIVAPPEAVDRDGFIQPDQMRAFSVPGDAAIQIHRGTWHENPMPLQNDTRLLVTSHANLTLAHQQSPDSKLQALPLDLERRWYKAGGYDISIEA
jgi:ureidoglycolate lyase